MKIPIYRAKRIDSDEYVEGYLTRSRCYSGLYILPVDFNNDDNISGYEEEIIEIDTTTVSIHFPNMIDIKGDRIFASLQEDGRGGDILFDMEYEYTPSFDGLKFILQGLFSQSSFNEFDSWKKFAIIGVEE